MADRELLPLAPPPGPSLGSGEWRIDSWTQTGWEELAGFFDQESAEAVLAQMRQREPDSMFRIVHRLQPDTETDVPRIGATGEIRTKPAVRRTSPPRRGRRMSAPFDQGPVQRIARTTGALGLVALVALACAARWGAMPLSDGSRSTAGGLVLATTGSQSPEADAALVPTVLTGRWSTAGGDCANSAVLFQPHRELRVASDGSVQALSIESYATETDGSVHIVFSGGSTATYQVEADRLVLARARVSRIDIAARDPLVLSRCDLQGGPEITTETIEPTTLPNAPSDAFRLAVRVGDDLAATLALARGMRTAQPVSAGMATAPLHWVVIHGRAVLVSKLVAVGADPNAMTGDGQTMLSLAVHRQDVATVEALIAAGADPARANRDGTLPLDLAAETDNQLLIDILFAAGN